jgi:branched-chain amino acid transport system permease protein
MSWLQRDYRMNLIGLALTAVVLAGLGLGITNSFFLTTLIFMLISAISAIGLTLLFGFTGLASLGQAAFFGVGAYTASLLVERMHWPPLVAVALAIVVAAMAGWLIGRPLLRLSGNYLTMASLAFGVVMYIVFSQASSITGGLDPGFMLNSEFSIGAWKFGDTRAMYWVCSVFTLLALYAAINLVHSRFGRGLRALKTSEPASEGVGIPTVAYKTAVFAIAAGMAGLSGALYAFFMRSFNATAFGFPLSIELLIIVIIGSLRSVWGALFGALVVTLLPAALEHFNDYKLFIYGVIMVIIMLFLPDGLFHGVLEALSRLLRRKAVP